MTDELNPNPVITPILDLTLVMMKLKNWQHYESYSYYCSNFLWTSFAYIFRRSRLKSEQIATLGGTSVKFEQNNYSPEALTEIEIYRQTKNQLSQLKSVLAVT